MTMDLLIASAIVFGVGLVGGFILTWNGKVSVLGEIRLGTTLFTIICLIWWVVDKVGDTVLPLAFLWLVIVCGVRIGEEARLYLIRHMLTKMQKTDIQMAILELVRLGNQTFHLSRQEDFKRFQLQHVLVNDYLNSLIGTAQKMKQDALVIKLSSVLELVEEYKTLTTSVVKMKSEPNLVKKSMVIGNQLIELSWSALEYAEMMLRKGLDERFSTQRIVKG